MDGAGRVLAVRLATTPTRASHHLVEDEAGEGIGKAQGNTTLVSRERRGQQQQRDVTEEEKQCQSRGMFGERPASDTYLMVATTAIIPVAGFGGQ